MKLAVVNLPVQGPTAIASADGEIFVGLADLLRDLGKEDLAVAIGYLGLKAFVQAAGETPALTEQVTDALARTKGGGLDLLGSQWMAPLSNPNVVCVANNNTAFAKDIVSGPKHPALFNKPTSALIGCDQPIELRKEYGITYPEPELAVVLAKRLKNASPDECRTAVFGYTIHNDVTSASMRMEDTFHLREAKVGDDGGYEMIESHSSYPGRYKGADTFGPMGPWIVTADEIPDPHALAVECWMEDELAYSDNTRNLTHYTPDVVSWASHYQTLNPGDIVSMGTASDPGGETGDTPQVATDMSNGCKSVSVRIEKIGALNNSVKMI